MGESDADRPNPARVVADADVLAADLLIGGAAREALDLVRGHSWVELPASDALLADAERVIERCSDRELAAAWRDRIEREHVTVGHPAGDHPALASAYQGNAAHLLSLDEELRSARTGAKLRTRLPVSIKTPDGFCRLFDPASLHAVVEGGTYPGPDRDPRE
jgi:predicted nucleic acid-binding protein